MLPPPLKPSLKPVFKVWGDFNSHLPWLGQVIEQREVGLLTAFCCQLLSVRSGVGPVPFHALQLKYPLLTNVIAPSVGYLKSVSSDSYYSSDHRHVDHVPSVCENPAVFRSCCWLWKHKWSGISGSLEFIRSARCLPWNKSLWIHYTFPWCLLRDVSLVPFSVMFIYCRD